jgi:hypothetical protein
VENGGNSSRAGMAGTGTSSSSPVIKVRDNLCIPLCIFI